MPGSLAGQAPLRLLAGGIRHLHCTRRVARRIGGVQQRVAARLGRVALFLDLLLRDLPPLAQRCVAQAVAALRQWWVIADQQVEELGDAAEAGRDALLDATGPARDLPRAEEVPDAAGAKPQRRVAGERSRHGRAG